MKRIALLILTFGLMSTSLVAQENEEVQYLPEAGDWSIGIDAKPLLNFVGNLFNGSNFNNINQVGGEASLMNIPTVSLMGKYMLTDNLAIKANLGILIQNNKSAAYVRDDAAWMNDPLSEAKVKDVRNTRQTGISIMAGAEYRVGNKRVQGVFGAGLLFGVNRLLTQYTYGNQMTDINQTPTSSWGSGTYRTLKDYSAQPNIYAGLAASVGVEWFVAPKISLGAEVSLCAGYDFQQQTYTVSEGYNTSLSTIEEKTDVKDPPVSGFSMSTKNMGGSIYVSFYF